MSMAASLFDRPAGAVLGSASEWTQGTLGGTLATALCVIAVAMLGLLLLAGRLHVRRGVEVVLGCFLLLGAGSLAALLQETADGTVETGRSGREVVVTPAQELREPLPPASYDPYAGASLRQDR